MGDYTIKSLGNTSKAHIHSINTMTTATQLTEQQLEQLATLQTGLCSGEELGVLNPDTAADILSDCLTKLGIDYDQYCQQLDQIC